jgi:branched-chain amino acid transport system ATP-binding protein
MSDHARQPPRLLRQEPCAARRQLRRRAGEIVALLGRNGSGRSTTVKAIMGLVDGTGHRCVGRARDPRPQGLRDRPPGIGYVPENRDIFPQADRAPEPDARQKRGARQPRWSFDDMYRMFPRLKERQHTEAGVLSGGEQQMLTLCRTLMGDPDLIMIDEPTEGPGAEDRRAGGRVPARAQAPRHCGAAGGAEAHHRARHRRPLPGHGPRQIVFAGTPAELRANSLHPQGVAGGLR